MTAPIDIILQRLDKPRQRQANQWSARCPAHEDKSPSLSVRENTDGAVLLHCFGGCEASEVVAALGLEMHDLFPPRDPPANAPRRAPRAITASQAIDLLHDEALIITIVGADIARGVAPSPEDMQRVLQATGRVAYLRAEVMT